MKNTSLWLYQECYLAFFFFLIFFNRTVKREYQQELPYEKWHLAVGHTYCMHCITRESHFYINENNQIAYLL